MLNLAQAWIRRSCNIDAETGCWVWVGASTRSGYGRMGAMRAHRASFEAFKGEIPEGLVVMHTCDRRSCVNPDHLVAGTQQQNLDDMRAKGRQRYLTGSDHPGAKLSESQIAAIRDDKRPLKTIAAEYGVSSKTVEKIRYRERWKHVA